MDSTDPHFEVASTDDSQQVKSSDKRRADVVTCHRAGKVTGVQTSPKYIQLLTENGVELTIQPITPEIIRLKYHIEGDAADGFSYALDPGFHPEAVDFKFEEHKDCFELSTGAVICRVTKDKLLVDFRDSEGTTLCKDADEFYRKESILKGITELRITKNAPEDTRYFGLGDKTIEAQNLRGQVFENWNTDAFGYNSGDDPLYRSIPFYTALSEGKAYGIFLDNTFRTRFSFDHEEKGVSFFSAAGGVMDYYFICGPELTSVARRYAQLTGTPELPPLWALGHHQSRWSYYPDERVREVAQTFRELDIPCDAIYLDIDYMEDYKSFTWDGTFFPDPATLIKDLKVQGFRTITIIDPAIKQDSNYSVYREGVQNGYFCKRPDGELTIVPVWPGRSVLPDFTHVEARKWWARLNREFIVKYGIDGIWNDMNEPAVFEITKRTLPEDIRHDYDGRPCSHAKAHNIYGMQMARASRQGISEAHPDKRAFLLTRANFAGGQRYAALWTGDNSASWAHLKLAAEQCVRLSISGYSFVGTDVGGFTGKPGGELFTRWLQLGVFHPLFRNHAMGFHEDGASAVTGSKQDRMRRTTTTDREPWSFGQQYTDINRRIINLRYRLLHYLYTAMREYTERGTPVMRPLGYLDQTDPDTLEYDDQFCFGDSIIVAPVFEKGQRVRTVYLPRGTWYHFWDHKACKGEQVHEVSAPLEQIPFFMKAGSVLPLREVMQYTGERTPEVLELRVYYSEGVVTSALYEDAEEGYAYREGGYRLTTFETRGNEEGTEFQLKAGREGSFSPSYSKVEVTFIGLTFEPERCEVDGKKRVLQPITENGQMIYQLILEPGFKSVCLRST